MGIDLLGKWLLASGWLTAGALVLARVSGVAWTAPGWGTPGLGWRLRLMLSLALTALVFPAVGPKLAAPGVGEVASLVRWCAMELLVGAALGWSASLVVAGARQAGEVVGAQMGLSAAALIDPDGDHGDMTPLGHLYGLVAVATFLALDGPLKLVGSLLESYRVVPAGGITLSEGLVTEVFGRVGRALELSLRLAAPAALALALAGVALALIARAAPALQLSSLAWPARAAVGMVLVFLGLAALAASLAAVWPAWPGLGT